MSCEDDAFNIRRGNTRPMLEVDASTCDGAFDFSDWTITARISGPKEITGPATGYATGLITYEWQAGDTDIPGIYSAVFDGVGPDGEIQTFPTKGAVTVEIGE